MARFSRSLILASIFFIFGIGSLIVGFVIFPLIDIFSENKKEKYSVVIHNSWKFFLNNFLIKTKLINIKIEDLDKIQNIKNSIIVSTHPSYIDVLIILALIPKTTCFVAPKITKNIFFKNIANSMFLSSGENLEELIKNSRGAINDGFNILIFPMGTRHRKNEFPKIKKGASLIALETKKDIVTLKLYTDLDFLQINQPFYDANKKTVNYELSISKVININEIIKEVNDSFDIKKEITKEIKIALYSE